MTNLVLIRYIGGPETSLIKNQGAPMYSRMLISQTLQRNPTHTTSHRVRDDLGKIKSQSQVSSLAETVPE